VTAELVKPDKTEPVEDGPSPGGPVLAHAAGVIPILIGLVTLWFATDLGLGSLTDPGPGLWPAMVSVLLVGTGAWIVYGARTATDTEAFTRETRAVGIGAASLAVYAYLFELIGFEIPTVLLLTLWLKFLGNEGWLMTGIVSVLSTAAAYLLFITGLGVPLPHLIGS
jgi:hypothetical protein